MSVPAESPSAPPMSATELRASILSGAFFFFVLFLAREMFSFSEIKCFFFL